MFTKIAKNRQLFLILLLALFLRSFKITEIPRGLNWDEVSIGYNAYSILNTGRDEWGRFLPLAFEAYGEYKLPLYIYASIPAIFIFGLSEFSVRITAATIGVLTIYIFFIVIKRLTNQRIGLYSSFFLAISPWHIHLTRSAFEASLALLFNALLINYLHSSLKNNRHLLIGVALGVLSMYSYNSSRIIIPLLLISFIYLYRKRINSNKISVVSILIILISLTPLIFNNNQLIRLNNLSIYNDIGFLEDIGQARIHTPYLNDDLKAVIHNKYTHTAHRVFINYLKTLSTDFLFLEGDAHTQRSTQGIGLLYIFQIPLLFVGIYRIKELNNITRNIFLMLLFISPIPSAITIDAPSALRSFNLILPLTLLSGLGIDWLFTNKWSKIKLPLKISLFIFAAWNVFHFSYRLFGVYPAKYSADWNYGQKESIQQILQRYEQYDRIYITTRHGEPYMYVLFYTKFDPGTYQTIEINRSRDETGWVHVDHFDKYYFIDFQSEINYPQNIINNYNDNDILFLGGFTDLRGLEPFWSISAPNYGVIFELADYTDNLSK